MPLVINDLPPSAREERIRNSNILHFNDFDIDFGPLYTWDWEPETIPFQALSLVEKAEPVQVHFTLCLRDQRSMWMQDGCKVCMDSCMPLNGSCFIMVTWNIFKNPLLSGRPDTKPGHHGTPNAHNHWFSLFYHVWGPTTIEFHWNNILLRVQSHMTSRYTWESVTKLHDFGGVLRRSLNTFFWALTISWSWLLARAWSYH
jgi:hypothetical protein